MCMKTLLCIIIKVNGAIVVKQSVFFKQPDSHMQWLVCMYIYGSVCIHIYTVPRRERLVCELGWQGNNWTRLSPFCFAINKYTQMGIFTVEFGFNLSLNFLYNCVIPKLPHAIDHHKSSEGLLVPPVLINISNMTKAYQFGASPWEHPPVRCHLWPSSPLAGEGVPCLGEQIHNGGPESCVSCPASAEGSLCEAVYIFYY